MKHLTSPDKLITISRTSQKLARQLTEQSAG